LVLGAWHIVSGRVIAIAKYGHPLLPVLPLLTLDPSAGAVFLVLLKRPGGLFRATGPEKLGNDHIAPCVLRHIHATTLIGNL
jgi:hypothetical protein